MKVLHLSSESSWRGGEQQIAYLIDELNENGVDNFVACKNGSAFERYCQSKNIQFKPFSFANELDVKTAVGIMLMQRKNDIDIIHAHSAKSHGIALLSYLLGNKIPVVVSRRVDFPVDSAFAKWKYNHKSIKKIICVSKKTNEIVKSILSDKTKSLCIYSGIDNNKFTLQEPGSLREKFIIKEKYIIANTSALAPHKDYFTFIKTAQRILDKRDDVHFLIIGNGPLEKEIKKEIFSKNLNEYITMTGYINDIYKYLPGIDIFLITSETEGLGTSILDAFAAGVPVVATRAGGIPEIVINEKTGLTAEIKDNKALSEKVIEIIENREIGNKLAANAREFVKKFDKKITAVRTLEVYKEII